MWHVRQNSKTALKIPASLCTLHYISHPFSMGRMVDMMDVTGNITWQRWRDFSKVIKAPNQLFLSYSKKAYASQASLIQVKCSKRWSGGKRQEAAADGLLLTLNWQPVMLWRGPYGRNHRQTLGAKGLTPTTTRNKLCRQINSEFKRGPCTSNETGALANTLTAAFLDP